MYLIINKCVTAVILSNFSRHYLRNRLAPRNFYFGGWYRNLDFFFLPKGLCVAWNWLSVFCSVGYTPHHFFITKWVRSQTTGLKSGRMLSLVLRREAEWKRERENWIGSTKSCGCISAWFPVSSMHSHRRDPAPN